MLTALNSLWGFFLIPLAVLIDQVLRSNLYCFLRLRYSKSALRKPRKGCSLWSLYTLGYLKRDPTIKEKWFRPALTILNLLLLRIPVIIGSVLLNWCGFITPDVCMDILSYCNIVEFFLIIILGVVYIRLKRLERFRKHKH